MVSFNSDGEYMAGQLASYGYNITSNKDEAHIWVLNGCTVKNPSQDVFVNALKEGKSKGKHVVLAGCVSQGQPNHKEFQGFSIVGVQQIDRIVEVVEETLKGAPETTVFLSPLTLFFGDFLVDCWYIDLAWCMCLYVCVLGLTCVFFSLSVFPQDMLFASWARRRTEVRASTSQRSERTRTSRSSPSTQGK